MKHSSCIVTQVLFLLLAGGVSQSNAQPFSVIIRLDQATQSPNGSEWQIYYLHADVYDQNGMYVQPSSAYYYHWYWNQCNGQGYETWTEYFGLA